MLQHPQDPIDNEASLGYRATETPSMNYLINISSGDSLANDERAEDLINSIDNEPKIILRLKHLVRNSSNKTEQ